MWLKYTVLKIQGWNGVFGAHYKHQQTFKILFVTFNIYSEFRWFRKYFEWLLLFLLLSASSFCNFISVPDCPLFCFLLLFLLLMFWFLFSLISGSSCFSTVLFSFISTPYMFFLKCLFFFPLDLLISLPWAPSFVISSPSVPVPLFSADLSISLAHLFFFLPLSVMLAWAVFALPSPCSVFLSFQDYLFFTLPTFVSLPLHGMQPDRLQGAGQDAFSQRVVDGTIVLHNLYLVQLPLAYEPHLCKSRVSIITSDPQQSGDEEARSNFC